MIFIDANFIISLFAESEDQHNTAMEIWDKIKDKELIISNSIILEVMTILNIRIKISRNKLEQVYKKLNSGIFLIVEDLHLYNKAMERQIDYYPERLPFADCLYLELIDQMNITEIVTFDKHFDNKEGIVRIY